MKRARSLRSLLGLRMPGRIAFWLLWACSIAAYMLAPCPSPAKEDRGTVLSFPAGDAADLDKAVARLAKALTDQGNLKGQALFVSSQDIFEAGSGLSLPLAVLLREKLLGEMRSQGVRVILPPLPEESNLLVQGTWQKEGKSLGLYLKVIKQGEKEAEAVAAASVRVPLSAIEPRLLERDRDSWARYLVRGLESNYKAPYSRTLHLTIFTVKGSKACPELPHYLGGWLRPAFSESRCFEPLDPQRGFKGITMDTLRTRGVRGIAQVPKDAPGLTADLLSAKAELKGECWLREKSLELHLRIADREGRQLTATSAEVPRTFFPPDLFAPCPSSAPSPVPSLSKGGLSVELTTTRGEDRPLFRKGERIQFLIRVNRSAYVYLMNVDSAGKATLLYPVDEKGNLAQASTCGSRLPEGSLLVLPEDGCSYDLVASEPFGSDTVLCVAAESPLSLPTTLDGEWARAEGLLERMRKQGLSGAGGYAEAQVQLVTGP